MTNHEILVKHVRSSGLSFAKLAAKLKLKIPSKRVTGDYLGQMYRGDKPTQDYIVEQLPED